MLEHAHRRQSVVEHERPRECVIEHAHPPQCVVEMRYETDVPGVLMLTE